MISEFAVASRGWTKRVPPQLAPKPARGGIVSGETKALAA